MQYTEEDCGRGFAGKHKLTSFFYSFFFQLFQAMFYVLFYLFFPVAS